MDGNSTPRSLSLDAAAEAERARERLAYLAGAGAALAGSLELEATLETVACLAVPRVADWCAVYLPEGEFLSPLAVAHADPRRVEEVWAHVRRYPMAREADHGTARALRSGEPVYAPELTDEALARAARSPGELAGMRRLGMRSFMAVPMRARGETLGVISFAAVSPRFTEDDLTLAVELAGRAALALDNARLYRQARDLAASLERQVEERTAELEAKNAEQEVFVYTVSHDLRAPLLSIQGMAELLEEAVAGGDADGARFALGRVRANAVKMGRLLDDLLALSRAGRSGEEIEGLDLAEVVREAVAELENRLRERGVELELPERWPRVRYPRSEAYQLLANLLGNAAKFAGRAGEAPRVAVRWALEGDRIALRVSDNGPGVPPEYRERVWDLFQRLDTKSEGTGVGLAIVRRVAERHGGSAWIEDAPPPPEGLGGATFTVTLPADAPTLS